MTTFNNASIQSDLRIHVDMLEMNRDRDRATLRSLFTHMRRDIEKYEKRMDDPTQPMHAIYMGSRADDVGKLSERISETENHIHTLNMILARDAKRPDCPTASAS